MVLRLVIETCDYENSRVVVSFTCEFWFVEEVAISQCDCDAITRNLLLTVPRICIHLMCVSSGSADKA
jgi:hypothetical protein